MSNTAHHTPGPWYTNFGQIMKEATGQTLALLPYFDKDNEEDKANADLISRAPDLLKENEELKAKNENLRQVNKLHSELIPNLNTLNSELLEALKELNNACDYDDDNGEYGAISWETQSKVNKAIAKAEGRGNENKG